MKRIYLFLVLLVTGAMLLAACGGGGSAGSGTASSTTTGGSGTAGGAVTPGASGIKDAKIVGNWSTADGGYAYDFKDDFSVTLTNVGSTSQGGYNIVSGGDGKGKIQITEGTGSTVWDYELGTDGVLRLTTPDGRAKNLRKVG